MKRLLSCSSTSNCLRIVRNVFLLPRLDVVSKLVADYDILGHELMCPRSSQEAQPLLTLAAAFTFDFAGQTYIAS